MTRVHHALFVALVACSNAPSPVPAAPPSAQDDGGSGGGGGGTSGGGDDASLGGPFADFPDAPIVDGSVAPSAVALLGGSRPAPSGGPCLVEPEVGALYPKNWLRPRFKWMPASPSEDLFELRLHVDNQTRDLVVVTASTSWTMPLAMWNGLRDHSADVAMTLTIRGAALDGATIAGDAIGSTGPIGVAPVEAPGSIVYWTTRGYGVPAGVSALKGFSIGDESVVDVLAPSDVSTECIGCHASTPDGKYAGLTAASGRYTNVVASIEKGSAGAAPPFLSESARAVLGAPTLGLEAFSPAHYAPGDRVEVAQYDANNDGRAELVWIDLEAKSASAASGVLARIGDPRHAGAPAWSHDGKTIAYVSTDAVVDGRVGGFYMSDTDPGVADVYTIPFADRAGGAATPLAGASDPSWEEYYPAFSPDDRLVAFDRVPPGFNMYNQKRAEVFVVPASGGAPTRLAANDPPACSGAASPGVTNSWPKWSPSVGAAGSRSFYWLVFSSTRGAAHNPQLYVTAVVVDGARVETHAALYLWNQPDAENNHTPAWDVFQIPQPPPR